MPKFLHIVEYSTLIKYKIPERKRNEYQIKIGESILRSYIDDNEHIICDDSIYNDSKLCEKTIPLDKIIIYDDFDVIEDKDQKLLYVFECPICFNTIISFNSDLELCEICNNSLFKPKLVALLNNEQYEDISKQIKQLEQDSITYEDTYCDE